MGERVHQSDAAKLHVTTAGGGDILAELEEVNQRLTDLGAQIVELLEDTTNIETYTSDIDEDTNAIKTSVQIMDDWDDGADHCETIDMSQLVPEIYDYLSLSYTGDNLTGVVYKAGGSGGSTAATLTLAYTGSVLDSVTRT